MARTQKEIKPQIKKEVDEFVVKLMENYPEIARTSLVDYVKTEMGKAMYEVTFYGKVCTNKERWG